MNLTAEQIIQAIRNEWLITNIYQCTFINSHEMKKPTTNGLGTSNINTIYEFNYGTRNRG